MLQRQEILLIRAALQFWSEEMHPEDSNLLAIYAGDPSAGQKWEQEEIQRLRSQLLTAQLRYVVCHADGTKVQNASLFKTSSVANGAMLDISDRLGVVLIADPLV